MRRGKFSPFPLSLPSSRLLFDKRGEAFLFLLEKSRSSFFFSPPFPPPVCVPQGFRKGFFSSFFLSPHLDSRWKPPGPPLFFFFMSRVFIRCEGHVPFCVEMEVHRLVFSFSPPPNIAKNVLLFFPPPDMDEGPLASPPLLFFFPFLQDCFSQGHKRVPAALSFPRGS